MWIFKQKETKTTKVGFSANAYFFGRRLLGAEQPGKVAIMDVPVPAAVKPLPGYRIWIKYSDGTEGEVDFSHLAGKGVFKFWTDYRNFQKVHISDGGAIAWSEGIEVCPDATYLKLTGKSVEDLFPSVQTATSDV